jgi:hypothetical protein
MNPEIVALAAAHNAAKAALVAAVQVRESEAVVRPLRAALDAARRAVEAWEPPAPAAPTATVAPAAPAAAAPKPAARPVKGRVAAKPAPAPAPPAKGPRQHLPMVPAPSAERAAIVAMRPAAAPVRPWRMSNRDPRPVAVETAATRAAAARASY